MTDRFLFRKSSSLVGGSIASSFISRICHRVTANECKLEQLETSDYKFGRGRNADASAGIRTGLASGWRMKNNNK